MRIVLNRSAPSQKFIKPIIHDGSCFRLIRTRTSAWSSMGPLTPSLTWALSAIGWMSPKSSTQITFHRTSLCSLQTQCLAIRTRARPWINSFRAITTSRPYSSQLSLTSRLLRTGERLIGMMSGSTSKTGNLVRTHSSDSWAWKGLWGATMWAVLTRLKEGLHPNWGTRWRTPGTLAGFPRLSRMSSRSERRLVHLLASLIMRN